MIRAAALQSVLLAGVVTLIPGSSVAQDANTVSELRKALDAQQAQVQRQAKEIETLRERVKALARLFDRLPQNSRPLPEHIQAKVAELAPGAVVERFDVDKNEKHTLFQIDLMMPDGQDGDIELSSKGDLLDLRLELTEADIPKEVRKTLLQKFIGHEIDRVHKVLYDDALAFRLRTRSGKLRADISIDLKGKILEWDSTVNFELLTAEVKQFITDNHPGATLRKAKSRFRDGNEYFELELRSNAKGKTKVRVKPDGTLVQRSTKKKKPAVAPKPPPANDQF